MILKNPIWIFGKGPNSLSHGSASCSMLVFVMRLYSLFCLMVLFCSFDYINLRKLPFSTAVGHHES